MKLIIESIKKQLHWAYGPIVDTWRNHIKKKLEMQKFKYFCNLQPGTKRVFYCGITIHPNLGDLAQRYCITNWIRENYSEHELLMLESDLIVNSKYTNRFFAHLKQIYGEQDVIIIQSGYCTQDLGGNHPLMHRLICEYMQDAKILMMPQTIYFQHEKNKRICAENHNKAKNMLFLARDFVSYDMAKDMFPDIRVKAFPDIVTTLIGTIKFDNKRNGVCLCTRNDGEKLYTKEEINALAERFEAEGVVVKQKDTQAKQKVQELVRNLKFYIESEIESYSNYQVAITDRYHGTIFSLCAGTPVIILKTTDHKVTTGADWFKGVYDDYVYVAEDLNDAFNKSKEVLSKNLDHQLNPYFKTEYYDKLKALFESNEINL
jgi:exopolysaccharide biosynthesis predicted pyruvyltransferase EpsI